MSSDNNKQPLVSVIMPTYNYAQFIGNAIKSALAQTHKNFELIIIDNYSDDNTEEMVRSFADSRIRYFKFNNHGMVAASRNFGIKTAQGEYLAFLDSDDSWLPDKLECVLQFINDSPDIDLVCHDEYHVNIVNPEYRKKARYGPYRKYKGLLFKSNSISTSAVVVRKSKVVKAGLFSEDRKFDTAEDYELWLRLSKICKIEYLHQPLGYYTIHGTSLSRNIERQSQNTLNVLEYYFDQWPQKSVYYKYLMRKRRAHIMQRRGRGFLKLGDFNTARSYLFQSMKLNPFSIKTWILLTAHAIKIRL